MTPTPAELLAECERLIELSEAVTKLPWRVVAEDSPVAGEQCYELESGDERICVCHEDEGNPKANAGYIAAVCNAAPSLARHLKRLVEERERWKILAIANGGILESLRAAEGDGTALCDAVKEAIVVATDQTRAALQSALTEQADG